MYVNSHLIAYAEVTNSLVKKYCHAPGYKFRLYFSTVSQFI